MSTRSRDVDELRRDYKIRSEVLVADLSDRAQIGKVAQRLAEDARPVDLLVNNAGYGMKKGFLANEVEAEEAMLDVLCTSVLVLSHAAARAMRTRGRGGIINVSTEYVGDGDASLVRRRIEAIPDRLEAIWAEAAATASNPAAVADAMAQKLIGR